MPVYLSYSLGSAGGLSQLDCFILHPLALLVPSPLKSAHPCECMSCIFLATFSSQILWSESKFSPVALESHQCSWDHPCAVGTVLSLAKNQSVQVEVHFMNLCCLIYFSPDHMTFALRRELCLCSSKVNQEICVIIQKVRWCFSLKKA